MIDWDNMTDGEMDRLNGEAWDACTARLRTVLRDATDLDLDGAKSIVEAQMISEMREYERLMKRGARSRASKLDREIAARAADDHDRVGFDMGMLWDIDEVIV